MKHKIAGITAVCAALCYPLMSAVAHERQPVATKQKQIAIQINVSKDTQSVIATIATNTTAQKQALDTGSGAPAQPDLSTYTGVLIDASGFSSIQRSPAPAIYSSSNDLVYPNREHVPTPDQVQDESIVRYYRSMGDAKSGVCGSNPLILVPVSIVGPAKDSVVLSVGDTANFKALDERLHYSDTWKVGFLIPSNQ